MAELRDLNATDASNTTIGGIGSQGTNTISNFDNICRALAGMLKRMVTGAAPMDDTFTFGSNSDLTKRVRISCSGVTAGQTRVLTMSDANLTLATMAGQAASSVAITGGTINGTTVGASTPAAGTFTTLGTSSGLLAHTLDTSFVDVRGGATNTSGTFRAYGVSHATQPGNLAMLSGGAFAWQYDATANTNALYALGAARLTVNGSTSITTTLPIRGQAGSAGAPALSFSGDTDTGIYSDAANVLKFSTAGTLSGSFDAPGNFVAVGSVTSGAAVLAAAASLFTFTGDTDTGMARTGADALALATGGTNRLAVSTTLVSSTLPVKVGAGATASALGSASTLYTTDAGPQAVAVRNETASIEIVMSAGTTVGHMGTQTNTDLALRRNNVTKITLANAAATFVDPIYGSAGSVANPSFAFSTDSSTGIYSAGSGLLAFTTSAGYIAQFSTTGLMIGATALINPANAEYGVSASSAGLLTVSNNNTGVAFRAKRNGTGNVIAIYNGTTQCGGGTSTAASTMTWDTSSDERLKTFTGELSPEKAIAVIRALPAMEFTWSTDGYADVGWSAQKSKKVDPRLATHNEETDWWGIDKGARTPWLWAALTGALDKIDALEARLAKLEA